MYNIRVLDYDNEYEVFETIYMYVKCYKEHTNDIKKSRLEYINEFLNILKKKNAVCMCIFKADSLEMAGFTIGYEMSDKEYYCDAMYIKKEFRNTRAFLELSYNAIKFLSKNGYNVIEFKTGNEKAEKIFPRLINKTEKVCTTYRYTIGGIYE